MEVIVERSEKFSILYNLPKDTDTLVCVGGRGGMKTYEVSKFVAYSATILKKRCVILRDEQVRIKESILNEIWARYKTADEKGLLSSVYDRNETELKDKKSGDTLIYTKGFRASTSSKQTNLKGESDIDVAVIEEAEDIRDVDKYNTFTDSLRKQGCLIIILLNTPDIGHWIVKRFFNTRQVIDGYYELIPRTVPGFACIQSSYEDNPYLPAHIVYKYKAYGDINSHLYNLHYYYTAILGYASTGRKGQILTKVKPISLAEYLELPYKEYYGQDFGTASPAATTGNKFEGNRVYSRLINYKPLPVLEIGKLYSNLKFSNSDRIVCDYAEPDSIAKLKHGFKNLDADMYHNYPLLGRGFFVVPCPSKDIEASLSLLTSMEIYVVEEDLDYWNEINNYVYAQDKYGNYTDTPIDDFNHAIDTLRYVAMDQRGKNKMYGI